ncbi:MAG: T9SS type A sorting domain-containing protein [Melioribacteraceae bacterium]|nr:MAG: T9SS type A sorting domain-containing protein [Melioribacteraceae bacterium]
MKRFLQIILLLILTLTISGQEAGLTQLNFIDLSDESFSQIIQANSQTDIFTEVDGRIRIRSTNDIDGDWQEISPSGMPQIIQQSNRPFSVLINDDGYYYLAISGGGLYFYLYKSTEPYTLSFVNQGGFRLDINSVKIIEGQNNELIVFASTTNNSLIKITSTDEGDNWSNPVTLYNSLGKIEFFDVFKFIDNSLTIIINEDTNPQQYDIYTSSDYGSTINFDNSLNLISDSIERVRIMQTEDETLYFVFNVVKSYVNHENTNVDYRDIYYITSTDAGQNWSTTTQLTKYMADDKIYGYSVNGNQPLLLINANRYKQILPHPHNYLLNIDLFQDVERPLFTYLDIPYQVHFNETFDISIFAVDNNPITSYEVTFQNITHEMKDDGIGADSIAGDNIYSVRITADSPAYDESTVKSIDINNVYMPFNNSGVLADAHYTGIREPILFRLTNSLGNSSEFDFSLTTTPTEYYGSLGKFEKIGFLFSGGFYLSGFANGQLFANAVASAAFIEDYQAGNVNSIPDDPKNIIYEVHADAAPFGIQWQKWSDAVDQGAYFYDGDENGVYSPIDHNGNGVWDTNEDRPDLLYDATYFTVYNDGKPDTTRRFQDMNPLGIEIRQTVFGSSRNTRLSNTVFVRYSLLNTGLVADTLRDVIFSSWQDPDMGDYVDDRFGSDTTLQSTFVYDHDNEDMSFGIPPAVYFTLVQGPKTYTGNSNDYSLNRRGPILGEDQSQFYKTVGLGSAIFNVRYFWGFMDPASVEEARNFGLGLSAAGEVIDPCTFEHSRFIGGNCNEVNPHFWVSGDPVSNTGWLFDKEGDIRNLLNTEKFDLPVNEPTDIIVAYTIDRGIDGMNSIDLVRERVHYIHEEYANNFSTIVGVDDKHEEVVSDFSLSQNYPNPFNPTTTIQYTIPNVGDEYIRPLRTQLIVYNILGQVVKTLVNELKTPGTYEVTFDASQLASGVYFYRLQSGSFMQTKKMVLLR